MTGKQVLILVLVAGLFMNGVCAKGRRRNKGNIATGIFREDTGKGIITPANSYIGYCFFIYFIKLMALLLSLLL